MDEIKQRLTWILDGNGKCLEYEVALNAMAYDRPEDTRLRVYGITSFDLNMENDGMDITLGPVFFYLPSFTVLMRDADIHLPSNARIKGYYDIAAAVIDLREKYKPEYLYAALKPYHDYVQAAMESLSTTTRNLQSYLDRIKTFVSRLNMTVDMTLAMRDGKTVSRHFWLELRKDVNKRGSGEINLAGNNIFDLVSEAVGWLSPVYTFKKSGEKSESSSDSDDK